jgi:hypothetical protein
MAVKMGVLFGEKSKKSMIPKIVKIYKAAWKVPRDWCLPEKTLLAVDTRMKTFWSSQACTLMIQVVADFT